MMKRIVQIVLGAVAVLIFTGCVSKSSYEPTENFNQRKAMVYVYMLQNNQNNYDYLVTIDGYNLGLLHNNNYLPIEVPTGKVTIHMTNTDPIMANSQQAMITLDDVKAGESYYVRAIPSMVPELHQMPASMALTEITDTSISNEGTDLKEVYRSLTGVSIPLNEPAVIFPGSEKKPVAEAQTSTPAAATGESQTDRLERLYSLKEKGAITDDEYNTLKAKILAE
jgi:hypothetical protein